jgi:hypothetical protein
MRALLIGSIVLIGLGVLSLAYYASPIRIMLLDAAGREFHLMVPMMSGTAILIGVTILFAIRPKSTKGRNSHAVSNSE